MKAIAIVAARMGSTRLPGKHLMDLGGRPMLAHVLERAKAIAGVDEVVLATTMGDEDVGLAHFAESACGVPAFRYSPSWDVLGRYADCARHHEADVVVRLTADCPLLDPELAALALTTYLRLGADRLTAISAYYWLDGLDVEVFSAEALADEAAYPQVRDRREHVTPGMRVRMHDVGPLPAEYAVLATVPLGWQKWSVDTPEDLARVRAIIEQTPTGQFLDELPPVIGCGCWSWQHTVEAARRAHAAQDFRAWDDTTHPNLDDALRGALRAAKESA